VSRPTRGFGSALPVRGCHPLRPNFPDGSSCPRQSTGLVRVRSPLLAESRLMSFPPGTEMFQFPGFASLSYEFRQRYRRNGGLPHSEIHGSKLVRSSPWLIAAYHVLHRLLPPRHSPDALLSLDCSHHQCPSFGDGKSMLSVSLSLKNQCPLPGLHQETDTDVKTRFSSRSTRQRKAVSSLTGVGGIPLQEHLRAPAARESPRSIPSSRCKR
jgi:hypothetical protein